MRFLYEGPLTFTKLAVLLYPQIHSLALTNTYAREKVLLQAQKRRRKGGTGGREKGRERETQRERE